MCWKPENGSKRLVFDRRVSWGLDKLEIRSRIISRAWKCPEMCVRVLWGSKMVLTVSERVVWASDVGNDCRCARMCSSVWNAHRGSKTHVRAQKRVWGLDNTCGGSETGLEARKREWGLDNES
jgi:hypothetical protein